MGRMPFTSFSYSTIEGRQDRNSGEEPRGRNWNRDHGAILLSGLSPWLIFSYLSYRSHYLRRYYPEGAGPYYINYEFKRKFFIDSAQNSKSLQLRSSLSRCVKLTTKISHHMLLAYFHLYQKGDWYGGHSQDELGHDYLKRQCFNLDSLHGGNRLLDLPCNRSLDQTVMNTLILKLLPKLPQHAKLSLSRKWYLILEKHGSETLVAELLVWHC